MADSAYTIKPFPQELHRKTKAMAALEGITLRELILKAMTQYVDRQQTHLTGSKPTLEALLGACVEDTRRLIGSEEAKRIGKWHDFKGNYSKIVSFIQWKLRGENGKIATRLDHESGMSLERIVLDYYPEFFNSSDIRQARRNLDMKS
ncbi:MAG: hypothetical protein AB1558_07070 [Thermodesulfobacteriota bacterium]